MIHMRGSTKYSKFQNDNYFLVNEPHLGYNEAKDFTSLVCWQKSRTVKLFFYEKVIPQLPNSEEFNLIHQMKRSGISITENIAEGYGRFHHKESTRFYRISRGSLYELKDDLFSCVDLKYISKNLFEEGIKLIEDAKVTLNGYIKYVKSQNLKKSEK